MKKFSFLLFLLSFQLQLLTESAFQTVRGKVTDAASKVPVFSANVLVVDSIPTMGAVTGPDGTFRLTKVPVGSISLRITFMGYEPILINNIMVTPFFNEGANLFYKRIGGSGKEKMRFSMSTAS